MCFFVAKFPLLSADQLASFAQGTNESANGEVGFLADARQGLAFGTSQVLINRIEAQLASFAKPAALAVG